MEKEQWKMIIDVFKIAQASIHVPKNEQSYLIALYACKQLKKWKWCYRFLTRGNAQTFSESFHETLAKLSQDLTEEEAKKFLAKPL